MSRWPGFCGPSYFSDSEALRARSINLYPERIGLVGGKAQWALLPSPGLSSFSTAPEPTGRGLFGERGRVFSAIGTRIYEHLSDGSRTALNAVAVDQYPATLVTNGDGGGELGVTSGKKFYVMNLSTGVWTEVLSSGATMVDMLDGYFIIFDIETSSFRVSDYLDGLTVQAGTTAQRSAAGDPWRSMAVNEAASVIVFVGERSADVWYNGGGGTLNPFIPVQGVKIPYGTKAPFSVKGIGGSVFWLTQTKHGGNQVVEVQGYADQIISTQIEAELKTLARTDDAVGMTYQQKGHSCYQLNFPSDGRSFVYDQTTKVWHERFRWDATNGAYALWAPQYHAYEFGKNLVLDSESGELFEMDTDIYTDGNDLMRRERIPPALFADHRFLTIDELELFVDAGVGLANGTGEDPHVLMALSRNGGKTFGPDLSRSLGKLGKYATRVRWSGLGGGRDLVPRFTFMDPVPFRLTDLAVKARAGV